MNHKNDMPSLIDDYLHGLLSPEDSRYVEQRCAESPEWAAELERGRRRLAVLQSLPPAEPSADLVSDTLARVERDGDFWPRARGRLLLGMMSTFAAAAVLLVMIGQYYNGLRPTDIDLFAMSQGDLLAGSGGSVRVRVADGRGTTALAGVPVLIELLGGGEPIVLARAETDEHGSVAPRFDVPDWADGRYNLRVTATTPRGTETLALPVQLKRSSRVMLSSDKPIYQPGQTVLMRALALRRPDLKPVAKTPAVMTLSDPRGNVLFKTATTTSEFGITSAECPLASEIAEGTYTLACRIGDTESKLTVEVKRYVLPKFKLDVTPNRPYYAPGEVARVNVKAHYFFGRPVSGTVAVRVGETEWTTKLDERGEAQVGMTAPRTPGTASFGVEVTDSAGQKQSVAVQRPVTAKPITLHLLPEGGTLVRGVEQRLYLLVLRIDGQPIANATVELMGDGLSERVTTDEAGAATVLVTPTGTLGVTWVLRDAGGMVITRDNVKLECGNFPDDFLLRPDRATYRAGESMTLTALGGGVEPVFVDVLRDGQTLRSEVLEINGELTIDLTPEMAGTLRLVAYRFLKTGFPDKRERIVHVAPADGLKVHATLDADQYRPRREAVLNVSLSDAKGKPVRGAVSIAAVDEAVFAVQKQRPGMEEVFFLLEQELMKPVYEVYPWSPDEAPAARRDAAAFSKTARQGGPAAAGGRTFDKKERETNVLKTRRLEQVRRAWVLLLITTLLSGYGMLYTYFPANHVAVGTLATGAVLLILGAGALLMVGAQRGSDSFFGGAFPGVADKTMAKGERSMPPSAVAPQSRPDGEMPKPRTHFPETLFWRPEVITDDDGKLPPQTIALADSITSWRLSVSGVSGDGRLGATTKAIKVFQPFFVDLDLPPFLTRGDEVTVPVVLYSYLDRPQTLGVQMKAGDGFELVGPVKQEVTLRPNSVQSVRYTLRAMKAGTHKLTVQAAGPEVGDAIEREVIVEPDGRRVESAFGGVLDRPVAHTLRVPADAIDGGTRAFVKVYPSGFSQLIEGLDAIFRLPSGCFEQTSSTTYPNVLALRYLKAAGKAAPAVEAKARQYIHLGYQRLVGFEVSGGGFSWFGQPPADVRLTAYGLMEFEDMASVHDVDPQMIARTRNWLVRQRKGDGSWGDYAMTAYVAWAVFRDGQGDTRPTREYLLTKPPAEITDAHTLALVCLALQGLNAEELPKYLEALGALAQKDEAGRVYWRKAPGRTTFYGSGRSAEVETTALAVLALLKRSPELTRQALSWLATKKDAAGTWGSTQATVLALQALIAGQTAAEPAERRFRLTVGEHFEDVTIPADQSDVLKVIDVSRHLKPGDNPVTLTEATKSAAAYQVVFRHHVPERKADGKGPFDIAISYDRTSLAVNEVVKAMATVTNQQGQTAPMVMVELPVPPGFDAEGFERLVELKTISRFETRPRSVVVYLQALEKDESLRLRYELRARLAVKAEAGPGTVYEYYDPAKRATTAGARFEVK